MTAPHSPSRRAPRAGARGGADAAPPLSAAEAWRLGYAHHAEGRFDEALACFERATLDGATDRELGLLFAAHASTAWVRGDAALSRRLADRAMHHAEASEDDGALAAAWVTRGLVKALEGERHADNRDYETALYYAERAGDLLTQGRILNNLGSRANEEGRHVEALGLLERAWAIGEQLRQPSRIALPRFNLAEAHMAQGNLGEALTHLEAAKAVWTEAGSPLVALASIGLGDVHRMRGNASQAAISYRESIDVAERAFNAQAMVPALSGLARVRAIDDPAEANGLIERALTHPAALGRVLPTLAAGWIALSQGKTDEAIEFGRAAEAEAIRRHDARGTAEALELRAMALPAGSRAPVLEDARAVWASVRHTFGLHTNAVLLARESSDRHAERHARAQLRRLGVGDGILRVAGALQALGTDEVPRVSIVSLGGFSVRRDGVPVNSSDWPSRKTRELLMFLVSRRGRAVSREVIADALWPGTPVEQTGNRLSVALSHLRTVLDPAREHAADHHIDADHGALRLRLDTVHVDVEEFLNAARTALAARDRGDDGALARLIDAADLIRGGFLDEDPYAEWADPLREEIRTAAGEVRRALARAAIAEGRHEDAIAWLFGLINDDPYDEAVHLALIGSLRKVRRHGEAMRCHQLYASRMAEIDVEPEAFADIEIPGDVG